MTPDQLREEAFREFEKWFIANYPGPETIISDPAWHAPKIFRAATHGLEKAHAAALEEIERLREAVELLYDRWENGEDCHEVSGDEMGAFLGKAFRLSEAEEGAVLALLKGIPTPSLMQTVTQRAEKAEAALAAQSVKLKADEIAWHEQEEAIRDLRAERDALKRHAEAMAVAISGPEHTRAVKAYREFKGE